MSAPFSRGGRADDGKPRRRKQKMPLKSSAKKAKRHSAPRLPSSFSEALAAGYTVQEQLSSWHVLRKVVQVRLRAGKS
jgi:hypothetical protein